MMMEGEELEARRAELEAVLHSEHFLRAPTLAHLLRYLCEKLFAGESHQIKEYSVGVEVFHRGPDFDQNTDSIVRVEANRLRKRLASYYAEQGASHRLRINIPLGQYVPEFAAAVETVPPAKHSAVAEAPSGVSAWKRAALFLSRRTIWLPLCAVVLIGLGSAWVFLGPLKQNAPSSSKQSAAQAAEVQLGPPVGEEIRILAGSSRSFVDHAGKLWSADAGFDGGTAIKSQVQQIARTLDPGFYRTSRQGNFRYNLPLKKGIYELRLHFAETADESDSTGGEGSRIFTVRANGKTLLSRFDIVADAGASRTADVKVFTDMAPAADGLLHLEFAGEEGRQAELSAIETLPGFRGHIRPVRLLARQTPYYSNDSHWWSPDSYFAGGRLATYSAPVSGTDDPELYETERWGNFSYAIPVAPGKYTVLLHFAARHGDWDQSPSASDEKRQAVAHVFNVFCNGNALLRNFDLAKEARPSDVVARRFTEMEPNAQGKLLLSFVPVAGYATVTGIEVIPQ
jgi:hypothetical protein